MKVLDLGFRLVSGMVFFTWNRLDVDLFIILKKNVVTTQRPAKDKRCSKSKANLKQCYQGTQLNVWICKCCVLLFVIEGSETDSEDPELAFGMTCYSSVVFQRDCFHRTNIFIKQSKECDLCVLAELCCFTGYNKEKHTGGYGEISAFCVELGVRK